MTLPQVGGQSARDAAFIDFILPTNCDFPYLNIFKPA